MTTGKSVFEYENQNDILIVIANGSLIEFRDSDVREAYNETYRLLCQPETKHLLVDFSKLTYFGSTFIGMLIRLAKKTRQDGGEAVLCHLSDNMKDMMKTLMLLENTKTDFFWASFATRAEAIASLQTGDQSAADNTPPTTDTDADGGSSDESGGWTRFVK